MKKIKLILVLIGLLAGGYYFYWKNENKHLSKDIYFLNNKVYSVFTDKEVSGYVTKNEWEGTIYTKYKDGVAQSEKVIDKNLKLVSKKNFNPQGLLDGKSYNVSRDEVISLNYKNNILNGLSDIRNLTIDFVDGAINGKNLLIDHLNPESAKQINYKNGIPDFITLVLPSSEHPKDMLVNVMGVPNDYTGGIITIKKSSIVINEYNKGKLKRERIYKNDSQYRNGLTGLKLQDTAYFTNGEVENSLIYEDGLLKNLTSYNEKGQRHGISYEKNWYSNEFLIKTYENGILNGNYEKHYINKEGKIDKLLGFNKLGIFSGQNLNCEEVENYLNGFRVKELDLNIIKNSKKVIVENLKEIPENFTGLNKDGGVIYEYKEGKLIKEYIVPQYSEDITVKEFKDDGGYYFNLYSFGRIQSEREMDKNGVKNGRYVDHFYEGKSCTKTTGTLVNNKMQGESIHYHGDEVKYIDIYHPNDTYTRTYYKDYKNNEIDKVTTGKVVEGKWVEE